MTRAASWLDDLDEGPLTSPASLDEEDSDEGESIQRFVERGRRLARKPPRRRSVKRLVLADDEGGEPRLDDPGLQALAERGLILELLWELKSGKEATVYVARGPAGLVAAKLYIDPRVRSFRDDRLYREGRYVGSDALDKAIAMRSRTGVNAQHHLWVQEEYRQMLALSAHGVSLPQPIACEGSVVLMAFIGDEDGPAPRLADARLGRAEAEDAFSQCVDNLALIVSSGRVHGDYSTFNVLWHEGRAVVIDFPQVVEFRINPAAPDILRRDVEGLCRTFQHFGLHAQPDEVLARVWKLAGGRRAQQVPRPPAQLSRNV